jgi:hypothetical protein
MLNSVDINMINVRGGMDGMVIGSGNQINKKVKK